MIHIGNHALYFGMFILLAFDTNVLYDDNGINNLCTTISNELDKLHAWFTVNKVSLNISKINYTIWKT